MSAEAPDLSALLSGLTGNPQAMAMLSSLLGSMQAPPGNAEEAHNAASEEKRPQTPPCREKGSPAEQNRRRLLLALKPYMSPARCQAIDRILMITDAIAMFPGLRGAGR